MHPWVGFDSRSKRSSRAFKDAFTDMMAITTILQVDMKVAKGIRSKGLPKILDQLAVKFANTARWKFSVEYHGIPTAEVDSD